MPGILSKLSRKTGFDHLIDPNVRYSYQVVKVDVYSFLVRKDLIERRGSCDQVVESGLFRISRFPWMDDRYLTAFGGLH